jgi:hypothetical protein
MFLISCNSIFGQNITGIVIDAKSKEPIEFVNIGIVGRNIGTVSDIEGKFKLYIDSQYNNDSIRFSAIGYEPRFVNISKLRNNDNIISLKEKYYEFSEVVIRPKRFKTKTLGVTTKFNKISAGFSNDSLGYECGILMKVNKTALLKQLNINISSCSYDTVFYRLNIYKIQSKMDFVNILREPIYIKLTKDLIKDVIQIDLKTKEILVHGDFLITLEHIKDLGKGYLFFCAGIGKKTYFRKTSQGKWETVPVGISISVIADVEK